MKDETINGKHIIIFGAGTLNFKQPWQIPSGGTGMDIMVGKDIILL